MSTAAFPRRVRNNSGTSGLCALFFLISLLMGHSAEASSAIFRGVVTLTPSSLAQIRAQLGRRLPPVGAPKAEQEKNAQKATEKAIDETLPPEVRPVIKPLIRWLLVPNVPNKASVKAENENDDSQDERDFLDGRAPHNPKVEQMMRAAETAVRRQEWKAAQELLQRILDLPEDSLHRLPEGRWESVRKRANQLLATAPRQFLEDYRTQYSGLAQQLLNEARRSGNTADYVSVATRFLQTPAGAEAANYLGTLHFDRGEFGLAASWFDDISRTSTGLASDRGWQVKAAMAYRQSGNLSSAQKVLEGITPAGKPVSLGVGQVDPETVIGSMASALPVRPLVFKDWKQMYGSASRLGTSDGSEPLLSPLWNVPLTSSYQVRQRVNWILQDLQDQEKSAILAGVPLVVSGRVLYRDMRGVRAIDIETGKTIWESQEGVSAERILGGLLPQPNGRDAWRFRMQFQNDINEYQGQSVEYHPLASLMFRDGIYGVISSDGRQVFVIEDHGILSRNQPGQNWGWDGANEPPDLYGVPWKTNRLVSYDLKTGRPRWSIGGPETQESFELPLAGSYFYGTPAIDGDELLVVAGKGDDLRLWSLDRATGVPRWSQLIAYTDTKIEQDTGRRWYTAQVAADRGVIVCPTTVGWLVAVDRLRQSVMWAHRYQPPSISHDRDTATQYVSQKELSVQWSPSAPIISGGTVVYTPPEEPIVLALNLLDGKPLWEKPKESWLYLAGVFKDLVLLVGKTQVDAVNLTSGKLVWSSSLDATPSGRGQAVDDQYYLPLSSGELRVLELKTGKKLSHGYAPSNHPPLGNLAMHSGKLVALGPHGLVCFGQRDAVLAEIQDRKRQDPRDAWALLKEAEIHLLNREHATALPLLQASNPKNLSEEEQARRHSELVECLAAVIRQNPKSHQQELDELSRIARTANDQRLCQELAADHLVAQGQLLKAFEILWSMRNDETSAMISRGDNPSVSMTSKVWLNSRLTELYSACSREDRDQVDARIQIIVKQSYSENPQQRRRVADLLGFHPEAAALQESLIEDLITAGDFGGAQIELLKLTTLDNRPVAARATERLARLMIQFKLPEDAVHYYQLLEKRFGDVIIRDNVKAADLVNQWRAEGKFAPRTSRRMPDWNARPLEIVNGPFQYMAPSQEIFSPEELPFFNHTTAEVQHQEQRLTFEQAKSGQLDWILPLKSSSRNQGEGFAAHGFLGHEIVLINRDVIHVVSPVEHRLMWSRSVDDIGDGGPFWRHATRPSLQSMATVNRDAEQSITVLNDAGSSGRMAVVQPGYLCVYGRRSISVLDPRTGELLWKKEGVPQHAKVVGNRDLIVLVPQSPSKAEAYRSIDGKPLAIPDLERLIGNTIQFSNDFMLLMEPGDSISIQRLFGLWPTQAPKTKLRLHQPLTREDRWTAEFSPGTLVSVLSPEEILVVPRDGKVERLEIATGKRTSLEAIPTEFNKGPRTASFALADEEHLYFMANTPDTRFDHYGESLPSVRANGIIHAWNRSDGKLAWRQEIKNQNLVVDRFQTVPVLLFVTRSWKDRGNANFGILSIKVVDKKSGAILHDSSSPSIYNGFHSLDVNLSEPAIELKSYNQRIRLVPAKGPIAEAKTPDKTP